MEIPGKFAQLLVVAACTTIAWAPMALADSAVELLNATSDAFQGTLDMQILVDADNAATGFQYVSPTKTQSVTLEQLASGTVLYATDGYNVVTVQSSNFDAVHGGDFEITYLNNAMSSSYDSLTVEILPNDNSWQFLVNDDQTGYHPVTQGYFKSNQFLGQVVGIDQITFQ